MIIFQQRFSGSMFDAEGHYVYLCAQHGVLLSSTSARWEVGRICPRCELAMRIEQFTALKCCQHTFSENLTKKNIQQQHPTCIHAKTRVCTCMKLWPFSVTWILSTSCRTGTSNAMTFVPLRHAPASKLINSVTLEVTPWTLEQFKHVLLKDDVT